MTDGKIDGKRSGEHLGFVLAVRRADGCLVWAFLGGGGDGSGRAGVARG